MRIWQRFKNLLERTSINTAIHWHEAEAREWERAMNISATSSAAIREAEMKHALHTRAAHELRRMRSGHYE